MEAGSSDLRCHVKNCDEVATTTCDRCGHQYCAAHVRHVSIQRREERAPQPALLGASPRVPTHAEIYTLCPHCWTKPVPQKPPQPTL